MCDLFDSNARLGDSWVLGALRNTVIARILELWLIVAHSFLLINQRGLNFVAHDLAHVAGQALHYLVDTCELPFSFCFGNQVDLFQLCHEPNINLLEVDQLDLAVSLRHNLYHQLSQALMQLHLVPECVACFLLSLNLLLCGTRLAVLLR